MPAVDPSAWLRPQPVSYEAEAKSGEAEANRPARQTTNTMLRPIIVNNMMQAVPHPHPRTGYKDQRDPCHRKDRTVYFSEYKESHLPYDEQPVIFRPDGTAVSARRVPGKSLMAPKLPAPSEYGRASRTAIHQRASHFHIGDPRLKDPTHYQTVNRLFYIKPKRMHQDPNPQIAAEANQWNHRALTFLQPAPVKLKAKVRVEIPKSTASNKAAARVGGKKPATVAVAPKWA